MGTLPRNVKILIGTAALLGLACVAIRVPQIAHWNGQDLLAVALIGALAAEAMAQAVLRAVKAARGIPGLPSAAEMKTA